MRPRAPSSHAPRPRRRRGAAESLGAVVLGFESVIVFLAGLVVYGLRVLPEGIDDWWGIVAGAVLAVVMILTAGVTGTRAGIVTGWVLQIVVLAGGFLVPALFIVGVIFGGMWAYATIKGASLDRRNAAAGRPGSGPRRPDPEPDPNPSDGEPT